MHRTCWPISFIVSLIFILSSEAREITWGDLLPRGEEVQKGSLTGLTEDQYYDIGYVIRIERLIERGNISMDGIDSQEVAKIRERLSGEGIDVDRQIEERAKMFLERQRRAAAGDGSIDGLTVKIPGYVLPLEKSDAGLVTEFLLVPWIGACIHTPPPPANQMVYVTVPEGMEDRGLFSAVWVEGALKLTPSSHSLFLVDGARDMAVSYQILSAASISSYSAAESDVLAKVEVPENLMADHNWWQKLQAQVSLIFTNTMVEVKDRKSPAALAWGLCIAFAYGLIHTLGPGHGKAVVISYFVGEGGSVKRGVAMGGTIAVFHVLSAIIIAVLTDVAVRQVTGNAPSDYKAIRMVSYAGIACIGGFMLWKAISTQLSAQKNKHNHDHNHHHHDCLACSALEKKQKSTQTWLSLAVGSVPCTGALLVLLYGLANDLLLPTILMVVAISVGMAIAMSGIGILAVLGRSVVDKRIGHNQEKHERVASRLRITGALCVLLIGVGLFCFTAAMG